MNKQYVFKETPSRYILLPKLGDENDYVVHIYVRIRVFFSWTQTIELKDLDEKKLWKMGLIKLIRL